MSTQQPYNDPRVDTPALTKGVRYVNKLLEPYGVTIETVNDDILRTVLTDKRTKNTKMPLTTNSIYYILSICKRKNPNITLIPVDFPQQVNSVVFTPNDELLLQRTILYYADILKGAATADYILQNRVLFDTAMMVVLTMATNLRSSELTQLTWSNYEELLLGKPLAIRIKKRAKSMRIIANVEMLAMYRDRVLATVFSRRRPDQLLLVSTMVAINAHFRRTVIQLQKSSQLPLSLAKLGVQCIRKINTTIIIANSRSIHVATQFNRHRDSRTTNVYNTGNYAAAKMNAIFSRVVEPINETTTTVPPPNPNLPGPLD